jgi:hypothetical protein
MVMVTIARTNGICSNLLKRQDSLLLIQPSRAADRITSLSGPPCKAIVTVYLHSLGLQLFHRVV